MEVQSSVSADLHHLHHPPPPPPPPPSRRPSFSRSSSSSAIPPYVKLPKKLHGYGGGVEEQEQEKLASSASRRSFFLAAIAIAIALALLLLGLSVFLVLHFRHSHPHSSSYSSSSSSSSSDSSSSSAAAAIAAACNSTSFPASCLSLLLPNDGEDQDFSPLRLASRSLSFAMAALRRSAVLLSAAAVSPSLSSRLAASAVADCVELADLSQELLNSSLSILGSVGLRTFAADLREMKVQISGALALQLGCDQGLEEAARNESSSSSSGGEATAALLSGLMEAQANVSEAVRIALGIVDFIAGIGGSNASKWTSVVVGGKKLELLHQRKRRRRSLLAEEMEMEMEMEMEIEAGGGGFPAWMEADQRRRLQAAANETTAAAAAAVVAADGSGDFRSIQAALDSWAGSGNGSGFTIHVKAGVYEEYIEVTKKMVGLTLVGDGVGKTIITGSKNYLQGITTSLTATVAIKGSGFVARGITFRNTAGPGGFQAVAVKAMADRAAFGACSFEGYQDTLYALAMRQFYTGCVVYGTIDFVFGDAAAVFQGTRLVLRQPLPKQFNTVTAHGRVDPHESTGFSFQGCAVAADAGLAADVVSYLGRPWRPYSCTVFLQCEIDAAVSPLGWVAWDPAADPAPAAVFYGEYHNTGAGSDTSRRVSWPGVHSSLTLQQADGFTVASLISGSSWLPSAQVAFQDSL